MPTDKKEELLNEEFEEGQEEFNRVFSGEDTGEEPVDDQPPVIEDETEAPDLDQEDAEVNETPNEDDVMTASELEAEKERLKNEYDAKIARAEQEAKEWRGRLEKAQKEQKALESKLSESQNAAVKVDDAAIKAFFEDFPEIAKPVLMMVQVEIGKAVRFVIDKVEQQTQPLAETVQSTARKSHFEIIKAAIPDVQNILESGALDKWVASKPRYVQVQLALIRESGTTQDVIDMLKDFKVETGFGSKPTKTPPAEDGGGKQTKLDALKAVPSSRTAPPKSTKVDPNDYESAWAEANRDSK